MSENIKKFLERVSANEELSKKLCSADRKAVIAMAKDLGIELTEADFVQANELDEDELDAVAGGEYCGGVGEVDEIVSCFCSVGGGGTKKDANDKTCACVLYGQGDNKNDGSGDSKRRCFCPVVGSGLSDE